MQEKIIVEHLATWPQTASDCWDGCFGLPSPLHTQTAVMAKACSPTCSWPRKTLLFPLNEGPRWSMHEWPPDFCNKSPIIILEKADHISITICCCIPVLIPVFPIFRRVPLFRQTSTHSLLPSYAGSPLWAALAFPCTTTTLHCFSRRWNCPTTGESSWVWMQQCSQQLNPQQKTSEQKWTCHLEN